VWWHAAISPGPARAQISEDAKYTNITPGAQADYADGNVLGSLRVVPSYVVRGRGAVSRNEWERTSRTERPPSNTLACVARDEPRGDRGPLKHWRFAVYEDARVREFWTM
jgi:hypothetical protein